MKLIFVLIPLLVGGFAKSTKEEPECDVSQCPNPRFNCHCPSFNIPGGLSATDTPQFVILSFDSTVTDDNVAYIVSLYNRTNPDKCRITYSVVDDGVETSFEAIKKLYGNGMDLALPQFDFGDNTVDGLEGQFLFMKKLFVENAGIAEQDIEGTSTDFGALGKDAGNLYLMMTRNKFSYEFSSTSIPCSEEGMWPFTLNYDIPNCESWPLNVTYPGIWTIPTKEWHGETKKCKRIDRCDIPGNGEIDEVANWLIKEFHRQTSSNRSPIVVRTPLGWMENNRGKHYKGFLMFLDYIQEFFNVFLVSPKKMIDWINEPRTVPDMIENPKC